MKTLSNLALAAVLLATLAACVVATSTPTTQAPTAPSLPSADTAGAQGLLSPDETLQVVSMPPAGSTTIFGAVAGYRSTAYAVPVAPGQTLRVAFQPSNANLYMNIHDTTDQSGAAVHRGEVDGPDAVLTASAPTTWLIRPFQPRAMARRNETGDYTIQIARD
jgi:hypothetical protein